MEYGSGHAMRSYQLYTALTHYADVDVVSARNWDVSSDDLKHFDGNFVGHIKIRARPSVIFAEQPLSKKLQQLVNLPDYDYVFVRYYNQAYWLGLFSLGNLILDCDDCMLEVWDNEKHDTRSNFLKRFKSHTMHRLLHKGYLESLTRANALVYSRHSKYSKLLPNAYEIPNKLKPAETENRIATPNDSEKITVLFVGVLNYRPNIDGIDHFLAEIWPHVAKECPQAEFTIVGAHVKKRNSYRWSTNKNVNMVGFVRDIEEAYNESDVCIVPVYRGGGVHIKIMETMKYGKPVLISSESTRGYNNTLIDGQNAMIAESDGEFISKLINLIKNKEIRQQISVNGQKTFREHYSTETKEPRLEGILYPEPRVPPIQNTSHQQSM